MPRRYANSTASSMSQAIGREFNELSGLEARARTQVNELERRKLAKKLEKMGNVEDAAKLKEAMEAGDAMNPREAHWNSPPTELPIVDSKLEKHKARLQSRPDEADEAREAYIKFDEAESSFEQHMPLSATSTPKRNDKTQGVFNFEGDVSPLRGTHDEAEELAGRRAPASHKLSDEERVKEEKRLAEAAEQEVKQEQAAFKEMANTAAEKLAAGAAIVKEKITEEIVPKAKETLTSQVLPKAKAAASTLQHKVVDEWAPKAAEKIASGASMLKEKITEEIVPKAKETISRTMSADAVNEVKEKASEMKEKVNGLIFVILVIFVSLVGFSKATRMTQSMPDLTEKAKEVKEEVKDKAMDMKEKV